MKQYLQDIRIDIRSGVVALKDISFNPLVLGTGASAIGNQLVQSASELLGFGYLQTDTEYKMTSAFFAQNPTVQYVLVHRKLDATAWNTALDALVTVNNDFWAVAITSTTPADMYEVENWAGANKKFYYGRSASTTIGDGRNQARASYFVHDQLSTAGYNEVSSESLPFVGATVPALPSDTYDLDVIVDAENSGNPYQLAVALLLADDWDGIATKIETALQLASATAPTVAIVDGKIKITSATTGDASGITIADGTAGNIPLLDYIDDNIADMQTTIETAVPGADVFPECAHLGRKLGFEPYKQWKWKKLNGIPAVDFNTTQLTTIRDDKCNTMTAQAGQIFTNGGFTVDGGYIDIQYSIDYLDGKLTNAVLSLYLTNESVGMTDGGLALLESVLRAELVNAGKLGIIAQLTDDSSDEDRAKSDNETYMFKINVPKRSDIPTNDRANRKVTGLTFSFTVAGAQDEADVDGILEV
jgi:hypothetical protein